MDYTEKSFIEFEPTYLEKIWGGNAFSCVLGRQVPKTSNMGEAWDISDNDTCSSLVKDGAYKGKSLNYLMQNYAKEIMGDAWSNTDKFPVMIKWLDSQADLSIQLHPRKTDANNPACREKWETWFFLKAKPNSKIISGLKNVKNINFLRSIFGSAKIKNYLKYDKVQDNTFTAIPSGCIHALTAGNLVLEIQQNSETTFRVYDWDRESCDCEKRLLHKEESCQHINLKSKVEFKNLKNSPKQILSQCPYFDIVKYKLKAGKSLSFRAFSQARILSFISGSIIEESSQKAPDLYSSVILPYCQDFKFKALKDSTIIITENLRK